MRRWVNAASVRSSVRPSPDKEPVGIYVGIDRHRYERTSLELVGQDLVGEALTVDRVGRVVSPRTCPQFPEDMSSVRADVLIEPNWPGSVCTRPSASTE